MTKLTTERVHELKIYPEFFHPVCTGNKRAELRKNDRDYRVGDTLRLFEYSYTTGHTGEYINVIVTHVADVSAWLPDYVLLSIKLPGNDAAPVLPKQPELLSIGELLHRLEEQAGEKWVEESAQPVIPEQQTVQLDPHVYRELVNELRDVALEYHSAHQLRERISRALSKAVTAAHPHLEQHVSEPYKLPDGWVMVPQEATMDMLKAGAKQDMKWEAFQYVWSAMLAAAPAQESE